MPQKVGNKFGSRTIPPRFLKANGAVKKAMKKQYEAWKAGRSASSRSSSGRKRSRSGSSLRRSASSKRRRVGSKSRSASRSKSRSKSRSGSGRRKVRPSGCGKPLRMRRCLAYQGIVSGKKLGINVRDLTLNKRRQIVSKKRRAAFLKLRAAGKMKGRYGAASRSATRK